MEQKQDLLLVIDMQNVYLPQLEWECPSMPERIRQIQKLLDANVAEHTVFTQFVPPKNAVGTWKQYNIENEKINQNVWLNEIVDELRPYVAHSDEKDSDSQRSQENTSESKPGDKSTSGCFHLYEKSIYSSMKIPEIAELARSVDRVVLTGVVAECCVLATMMEAIDLGCQVVYLTDCISGQSEQNEAAIQKIAESFAPLHTLVMTGEEYLLQKVQSKTE